MSAAPNSLPAHYAAAASIATVWRDLAGWWFLPCTVVAILALASIDDVTGFLDDAA